MNEEAENKGARRRLVSTIRWIAGGHTPSPGTPGEGQALAIATAFILPGVLTAFASFTGSPVAESFVAVFAVTLVLPPLAAAMDCLPHRLSIAVAGIASVSICLLRMPVTIAQSLNCILIAAAVAMLIVGSASLLKTIWRNATAISMGVTIVLLLWLSWPIWLSGRLGGHETWVNILATAHPLLALNGQLLDQAIWTERPLMYGWTALNQDVPFQIPTTVWWCVLLHGGLGANLLAISWQIDRYRRTGRVVGN